MTFIILLNNRSHQVEFTIQIHREIKKYLFRINEKPMCCRLKVNSEGKYKSFWVKSGTIEFQVTLQHNLIFGLLTASPGGVNLKKIRKKGRKRKRKQL